MSCEMWRPWLAVLAGDDAESLDGARRDELERHLSACPACRRALDDQRLVRDVLRTRTDAVVPSRLTARVVAALGTGPRWFETVAWRAWTYRLAPVAAALLVLAVATAQSSSRSIEPQAGLSELTETWAFGQEVASADGLPAFTLWGRDDVSEGLLLETVLIADPDTPIPLEEES